MAARHAPGSSGTPTTLALPGLGVMTAPRDGAMKVDRSTQLHESWDHGPIVAFRAELFGALPRAQQPKNDSQRNVVPNERGKGDWRVEKERGKKEHLQRQQTKSASPDI